MSRPVALVTGARRGIGLAIALGLANAGYDIAFTDVIDDEATDEASLALAQIGGASQFFQHDVADVASHAELVDTVLTTFGRLDCFVANAGIGSPLRGDLLELTPENFDRVTAVNQRGSIFLSQAVARAMLAHPERAHAIVFVTSVSAAMASPERADYCVSKAALSMWAKNLALRLSGVNIPVFEVRPGIIRTDMTAGVAAKYDALIEGGLVPAARWGEGEDVARIVVGLAAGAFGFSTGSIINCDGGLSIPRL